MLSVPRTTVLVIVVLWVLIGLGLVFGMRHQVMFGLVLLSFVLLMAASHVTFVRHSRRLDALLIGTASVVPADGQPGTPRAVLQLETAGMSPLIVERDALLAAFERAEAVQHQAWRFTFQRLEAQDGGRVHLALMTNGDTSVLNFRGQDGPGYRVILPTEELATLRGLLTT